MPPPSTESIFINAASPLEVAQIISKFDATKANGPNSIHVNVMKLITPTISTHISKLFNASIQQGIFPNCLKTSSVTPVYKKGDKNIVDNYRPISLLSNVGKIFEKLMYTRLYEFLDKKSKFYKNQYGFRKKYNTHHALIQITEKIRSAIDNNNFSCGVFVDLQKAFDTVEHTIPIQKLNNYGIRGVANKWIHSYLNGRSQVVEVHGHKSKRIDIKHGVPQGSVLGPLLFLIYINDLHRSIINSKVFHFADDTGLLFSSKSLKKINTKINQDLSNLFHWLRANKISLNAKKTELVIFKSPNKKMNKMNKDNNPLPKVLNFRIGGHRIIPKSSTEYLGVILDEHLTFKNHINKLKPKLSRAVGMLSKIRHFVSPTTLKNIYHAIFNSHLLYGIQVWIQGNNEAKNSIQILQNKALRLINFKGYRETVNPLFKSSEILKVQDQNTLNNCLFVHDYFSNKLPEAFESFVTPIQESHIHNTRSSRNNNLKITASSTYKYGTKSIKSSCEHDWNSMQSITKTDFMTLSRSQLKFLIKKTLLNRYE